MRRMRSKLTYANVMATLALFVALGGGAYAAIDLVGKNDIKPKHIARNAVKADKHVAGINALSATNRLLLQPGQSRIVARSGSLVLRARCVELDPGQTEARYDLETGENGTKFLLITDDSGDNPPAGSGRWPRFSFASEDQLGTIDAGGFENFGNTAATTPGNGALKFAYYFAFTPSGKALHGFAMNGGNVGVADRCTFIASGLG
jgi:hypothetical protein